MIDPALIISGLVQRGVPENAAIGLVGNMKVESGFDPGINEISPLVKGSRGGYGLIQWTGPRRRQLESYAANRGQQVNDLNLQLDFLVHELGTTENRARDAIYAAGTPQDAARLVSERFLRPGIPHLSKRIEATNALAGGSYAPEQGGSNALTGAVPQPMNSLSTRQPESRNALTQMQMAQAVLPRWRNSLHVEDFLV